MQPGTTTCKSKVL